MTTSNAWAAALLLFGCQPEPDPSICEAIRPVNEKTKLPASVEFQTADRCVHRASYQLANVDAEVSDIARAVETKCSSPIFFYDVVRMQPQSIDDITPETERFFKDQAIGHIVEARAGHCTVEAAEEAGRPPNR